MELTLNRLKNCGMIPIPSSFLLGQLTNRDFYLSVDMIERYGQLFLRLEIRKSE